MSVFNCFCDIASHVQPAPLSIALTLHHIPKSQALSAVCPLIIVQLSPRSIVGSRWSFVVVVIIIINLADVTHIGSAADKHIWTAGVRSTCVMPFYRVNKRKITIFGATTSKTNFCLTRKNSDSLVILIR